jgi:hypothetical protein
MGETEEDDRDGVKAPKRIGMQDSKFETRSYSMLPISAANTS